MVAWMAGLLYLPRLFVYHQENYNNKELTTVFKTMEKRLYFYIMNPSIFIVWFSGLYLGYILGFDTWLIIKIGLVVIMSLFHILLGKHLNDLKKDTLDLSSRYFRMINEIPFIILIFILIMVIMKPYF
tara:strand:+ start:162 stop:545 length:384 start_codon:yes stop_codon:yes gene_type:complete